MRPPRTGQYLISLILIFAMASCSNSDIQEDKVVKRDDMPRSSADQFQPPLRAAPQSVKPQEDPIPPLEEFQHVAVWSDVLTRYPDLPDKVEAIVEGKRASQAQTKIPKSEVRLHRSEDPASQFNGVSILITDLDRPSLNKILDDWNTIYYRAAAMGIRPSELANRDPGKIEVVILGSNGKVDIKESDGSTKRTVKIFREQPAPRSKLRIDAFGFDGESGLPKLAKYIQNAGSITLPPNSSEPTRPAEKTSPQKKLPPDLNLVAIGSLRIAKQPVSKKEDEQQPSLEAILEFDAVNLVTDAAVDLADAAFDAAQKNKRLRTAYAGMLGAFPPRIDGPSSKYDPNRHRPIGSAGRRPPKTPRFRPPTPRFRPPIRPPRIIPRF